MNFRHVRDNSAYLPEGTFCIDLPTKETLKQLFLMQADALAVNLGITVKSKEDQFCKKVGREKSLSKVKTTVCQFVKVEPNCSRYKFTFTTEIEYTKNKKIDVLFIVSTKHDDNNVHLIDAVFFNKGV